MKFEKRTIDLKNGATMTLEEAKPEDAAELIRYIDQVGKETDNLLVDENGLGLTVEQEQSFLRATCAREDVIMLIGRINGTVMSTSQMGRKSNRPRARHMGVLAITVAKDYWGLGAGTAIINALFDFAKNAGIEIVELDVRADNERAIGLYKKTGFEIAGTHRRAMKMKDGTYHDNYLMQAFLQP